MELPTPLILEDWEDHLKGLYPEPGPALPFRLQLEVQNWPHEVTDLFQRASPPRPYPHNSGSNPDEYRRMIWALNGMRGYLAKKLEALVQSYCAVSGQIPLLDDEFIVKADEERDRSWAGVYAVKKRLTEYSDDNKVIIRLVMAELEWETDVTGFSHEC